MSANELALKFSTASAEELIGVLPVREVKEALWAEVEDDVCAELYVQHGFELEAMEEQADEARQDAKEHEDAANAFATAIKLALTLSHEEAQKVLIDVIEDNSGYGRSPL